MGGQPDEERRRLQEILEHRRDEFRLYLEQTGVIKNLSTALLQMFEEPNLPDDPVLYFRKIITTEDFDPETEELSRLTEMVESLKIEIADLSEENERLRATLGRSTEHPQPAGAKLAPSDQELARTSSVMKDKQLPTYKETTPRESNATAKEKDKKKK